MLSPTSSLGLNTERFQFVSTQGGTIECDRIIKVIGAYEMEGKSRLKEDTQYLCVVNPRYSDGIENIKLQIGNPPSSFEMDWETALEIGNYSLLIHDVEVTRSMINLLPSIKIDTSSIRKGIEPNMKHMHGDKNEEKKELFSHFQWRQLEQTLHSTRDLDARNDGVKTAVVIRVSTSTHGAPYPTPGQLRVHVFGNGITMSTMFPACSHNKFFVNPGIIPDHTSSAEGVYDITIETDKDSTSGDIVNEVTRVFGTSWNEIDFKLLVMVRFYSILHDHFHFYTIGGVNSVVYGLCVALRDGHEKGWEYLVGWLCICWRGPIYLQ